MNLKHWRLIFIGIGVLSVSIILLPHLNFQKKPDPLLSIALLDKNQETNNYFRNVNNTISLNETINWIISVENNPSQTQLIAIRVKLQKSTGDLPDPVLCEPSPSATIYEINKLIRKNSTIFIPFKWKISNYNVGEIDPSPMLCINNKTIQTNINFKNGEEYVILFELWKYDENRKEYIFSWASRGTQQCLWNHLSFRIIKIMSKK